MQGPVPILIDDRIRVYFAARNVAGKSYPAFVDLDAGDPRRVLDWQLQPIMPYGPTGTFDDDGNMPACALRNGDDILLYYSGWNRRVTTPCHNSTGLAHSRDGGKTFIRRFDGPLLDRTPDEPYMAVTPWVMREASGWRMWYVSGMGWINVEGRQEPLYAIKQADSTDGVHWRRDGRLAVPLRHDGEAIARPTVSRDPSGVYHMWYSYRDSHDFRDGVGSYRIGYAQSADGRTWNRNDAAAGLPVEREDWEAQMRCYPYLLHIGDRSYLFYSGNSFGQSGLGCAVWEGPPLVANSAGRTHPEQAAKYPVPKP